MPGDDDTVESWFKVGGADAIADRLVADGKLSKPCVIATGTPDAMPQTSAQQHILRAADYKTWSERRKALEQLLLSL